RCLKTISCRRPNWPWGSRLPGESDFASETRHGFASRSWRWLGPGYAGRVAGPCHRERCPRDDRLDSSHDRWPLRIELGVSSPSRASLEQPGKVVNTKNRPLIRPLIWSFDGGHIASGV